MITYLIINSSWNVFTTNVSHATKKFLNTFDSFLIKLYF